MKPVDSALTESVGGVNQVDPIHGILYLVMQYLSYNESLLFIRSVVLVNV